MLKMPKTLTMLIMVVSLTGCDKLASATKAKTSCSDPTGTSVVKDIITGEAQKEVATHKNDDGSAVFDPASFRATLAKITLSVENIRTSKEDPNSTKVFCEGTLKMSVPVDVLNAAEEGSSLANIGTLATIASTNDFEQSANVFTKNIEYSVQPTDDGKQVFAQMTAPKPAADFLSGLVMLDLAKPMLEAKKIQQAKADEEHRLQEQQQVDQQQAEAQQERDAALTQAQNENKLALQSIGGVWKSLPADRRKAMLDEQRQWIKDKDGNCRTEAAGKSANPTEIETYRLQCDTAANTARIAVLQTSAVEAAVPTPSTATPPANGENPT